MDSKDRSLIKTHTAVLLFGLAGIFGKLINLPSTIIVFGRVVFASIFLLAVIFYFKQSIKLDKKRDYVFLLIMGIILAIHWSSFFQAIQLSTVAIGLLTFSTFPIFVTFMEPFFFKDRIRPLDVITALVTFFGILLVIPGFKFENSMTQGALWGILSGLSFALLSILNKKYVKRYSSLVISFYEDTAAAVVLFPFLFIVRPAGSLNDVFLLILLGVVFTGISHTLFISGLSGIKAQTASIIASLEPVYGIAIAALALGEIPSVRVIAGGILILGAAFYSTITS